MHMPVCCMISSEQYICIQYVKQMKVKTGEKTTNNVFGICVFSRMYKYDRDKP